MAGLTKGLLVYKTYKLSRNVVFDEHFYYLMIMVDNSKRSMAWPHFECLNGMASQKCY